MPAAPASRAFGFLAEHPAATDAVAALLGCTGDWPPPQPAAAGIPVLLAEFPETAAAVEMLMRTP